jgi:SAM-dependent methyltransferase
MPQNTPFSFGKNWENFLHNHFSEERVAMAQKHLLYFLEVESLKGIYFLDIGCGSGIHSLAALKAEAQKIISFDYDHSSVAATQQIKDMCNNPSNWTILQGSVLDKNFISSLEPADIVYSWGVLHHTGNLWEAVRNAASLITTGGLLYIAIYEKNKDTDFWIKVKKIYNASPSIIKRIIERLFIANDYFSTLSFAKLKDSFRHTNKKRARGMEFWTDLRDWLGGWPYEPATQEEVCAFCEQQLGLRTLKVKTGQANIEYLFLREKIKN